MVKDLQMTQRIQSFNTVDKINNIAHSFQHTLRLEIKNTTSFLQHMNFQKAALCLFQPFFLKNIPFSVVHFSPQ